MRGERDGVENRAPIKISAVAAALVAAMRSALLCFLVRYDLRLRLSLPLQSADFRVDVAGSFRLSPLLFGFRNSHFPMHLRV